MKAVDLAEVVLLLNRAEAELGPVGPEMTSLSGETDGGRPAHPAVVGAFDPFQPSIIRTAPQVHPAVRPLYTILLAMVC